MFTAVLFQPLLDDYNLADIVHSLVDTGSIRLRDYIHSEIETEWDIKTEIARYSVYRCSRITPYGIPQAVHISVSEDRLRNPSDYQLTRVAFEYYSMVVRLVEGLDPLYGFGGREKSMEPIFIPTSRQFDDGTFSRVHWLNVFGPNCISQYGEEALLDASFWNANRVGSCVVALATRNPFLTPNGYNSNRHAARQTESQIGIK